MKNFNFTPVYSEYWNDDIFGLCAEPYEYDYLEILSIIKERIKNPKIKSYLIHD